MEKETPAQYFSYEFCVMFKNALFTERIRTTTSEYRNIYLEHLKLNARKLEHRYTDHLPLHFDGLNLCVNEHNVSSSNSISM